MPFQVAAFKKLFWDSRAVKDPLERAKFSALAKLGAFVRRRDKSSLRYRRGKSPAGSPPFVHRTTGFTKKRPGGAARQAASPLRELTFFGVDRAAGSVVIGPAAFSSKVGVGRVPRVVEEGGAGRFRTPDGEVKVGAYRPRPHTLPAFRAEIGKWRQFLKDALRKAG